MPSKHPVSAGTGRTSVTSVHGAHAPAHLLADTFAAANAARIADSAAVTTHCTPATHTPPTRNDGDTDTVAVGVADFVHAHGVGSTEEDGDVPADMVADGVPDVEGVPEGEPDVEGVPDGVAAADGVTVGVGSGMAPAHIGAVRA